MFSRMIVGRRCASHMHIDMVLDAMEMARWGRGTHHEGLLRQSDAGSQFTSIRYGERLAEIGATLGWVYWHNTKRLHGYLGDVLPAEFEGSFYAEQTDHQEAVEIK